MDVILVIIIIILVITLVAMLLAPFRSEEDRLTANICWLIFSIVLLIGYLWWCLYRENIGEYESDQVTEPIESKSKDEPKIDIRIVREGDIARAVIRYNNTWHTIHSDPENIIACDRGIVVLRSGLVYSPGDRVEEIMKLAKSVGIEPISYCDYSSLNLRIIPLSTLPKSEIEA